MGQTAAMPRAKAALLLVATSLALVGAGCGGDDDSDSAEPPATSTTSEEGAGTGDAANGEQVFASAGCGGCHTFAAAGSTGSVGPDLDEASPSFDAVVEQVRNGGGAMPAFGDELSEQEIDDVAAFVTGS
jgi:mono/diheme cytochrome c family protein